VVVGLVGVCGERCKSVAAGQGRLEFARDAIPPSTALAGLGRSGAAFRPWPIHIQLRRSDMFIVTAHPRIRSSSIGAAWTAPDATMPPRWGLRRFCLDSCTINMSLLWSWPSRPNVRGQAGRAIKVPVNEVVMLSNDPLDFFYAAHNQMASTVMNMTISLTLRNSTAAKLGCH